MSTLADDIRKISTEAKVVSVHVSYEVVKLFSEQLYASPLKAIEELVVNSWDADARFCSVLVDLDADRPFICVYDNGKGMTLAELEDLWHIGVSKKGRAATARKQIGKFGIGKLASYAVARRATYISRTEAGIHAVSIDFQSFADATDQETGLSDAVNLKLLNVASVDVLEKTQTFKNVAAVLNMRDAQQSLQKSSTWTMVVLEDLKQRAHDLSVSRLRWVLSTAMPFSSDFQLFLNGDPVESSKVTLERVVEFHVDDLEEDRLNDLIAKTGEVWKRRTDGGLESATFPQGITGDVLITTESLYLKAGKSEDLGRSNGFFVRVHNRLINETDPLFGCKPLSFQSWNRFAATIEVPDLHEYITASRDDVEQSSAKEKVRELLLQLFYQARDQYVTDLKAKDLKSRQGREGTRDYVSTELIERPLADALVAEAAGEPGMSWRLVDPIDNLAEMQELVEKLYEVERKQHQYTFKYSPAGTTRPIARLDPRTGSFTINEDHELVREFGDEPESKRFLESFVVAEALLEVYLHAADVQPEVVAELLDRRDLLLRSLALDESYSLTALARAVRDAAQDASDLEVAIIGALRALGFNARHIGGPGEPDGVAKYVIQGVEETSFTLEAKSSSDVPTLPHLDFAGLRSHYEASGAKGCLLVAPSYPGADNANSEVSKRSRQQAVSCWTVEQLASLVECAARRHINARKIQQVVLGSFTPVDVTGAIDRLLSEPLYDQTSLYAAILQALDDLAPRLRGTPRNVSHIAAQISGYEGFSSVKSGEVREAVADLARMSSGMLYVNEDNEEVFVLGDAAELKRRLSHATQEVGPPRRKGTLRVSDPPG